MEVELEAEFDVVPTLVGGNSGYKVPIYLYGMGTYVPRYLVWSLGSFHRVLGGSNGVVLLSVREQQCT